MNHRRITPLVLMATMVFASSIISCAKNTTANEPQPDPVQKVQVGDIEMAYQVLGQGEPLMMIPGLSATMDEWSPRFLEDLSNSFQVIIFDNRGMGETSGGSEEFTIDRFADDLAGLMDALGIARANVLGWSMGGDVALDFAVRHPDKLDRLIVYAGDCGGTQRVFTEEVYRELEMLADPDLDPSEYFSILFPEEWMASHPDFWQDFAGIEETSSPENIRKQSEAYVNWEGVYDQLPDIARPTLVATGTEDISTPPENSLILAARIPGSWLVRFEGAGHGLMYQYPDEFAQIITDFVELSKVK
jgi:pimeloyl-ACP methyl ester carboxylesterase